MVISKSRINDGYQAIDEIRKMLEILKLDEFPSGFNMNKSIAIIEKSTNKLYTLFSAMEIELLS